MNQNHYFPLRIEKITILFQLNGITDFVISSFKRAESTSTYCTHEMCQWHKQPVPFDSLCRAYLIAVQCQFLLTLAENTSIGHRHTYQERISCVDRATFVLMKARNALGLPNAFPDNSKELPHFLCRWGFPRTGTHNSFVFWLSQGQIHDV